MKGLQRQQDKKVKPLPQKRSVAKDQEIAVAPIGIQIDGFPFAILRFQTLFLAWFKLKRLAGASSRPCNRSYCKAGV